MIVYVAFTHADKFCLLAFGFLCFYKKTEVYLPSHARRYCLLGSFSPVCYV